MIERLGIFIMILVLLTVEAGWCSRFEPLASASRDDEFVPIQNPRRNFRRSRIKNYKKMKPVSFPDKVEDPNAIKYEDLVRVMPSDLQNSGQESYVANRFGDKVIQQWLDSPQMKSSSIGQTANKVQNAMNTEVSLGGGRGSKNSVLRQVDHKLSFQVLALQAQTKLQYKGWTNATIKHDARSNETDVEISERIFKNKDVYINHVTTTEEDRSSLGVRWNW